MAAAAFAIDSATATVMDEDLTAVEALYGLYAMPVLIPMLMLMPL